MWTSRMSKARGGDRIPHLERDGDGAQVWPWMPTVTNFPLADTSWPATQDHIAWAFEGVTIEERDQILWSNAAKLYGLVAEDGDGSPR